MTLVQKQLPHAEPVIETSPVSPFSYLDMWLIEEKARLWYRKTRRQASRSPAQRETSKTRNHGYTREATRAGLRRLRSSYMAYTRYFPSMKSVEAPNKIDNIRLGDMWRQTEKTMQALRHTTWLFDDFNEALVHASLKKAEEKDAKHRKNVDMLQAVSGIITGTLGAVAGVVAAAA